MLVLDNKKQLIEKLKSSSISFVPTMGALHNGHISLIKTAQSENLPVLVSIFVNPLQFNNKNDFETYPINLESDLNILKQLKVDYVYCPKVKDIYENSLDKTFKIIPPKNLTEKLCGLTRPGHFEGMATVVLKLFNIVKPQKAFFGLKDYQQFLIIKQMVKDLNLNIDIIGCPTVRDEQGLALSSRNQLLSPKQKTDALTFYKSLLKAKEQILNNNKITDFLPIIKDSFRASSIVLDYFETLQAQDLEPINDQSKEILVAVAGYLDKVRLIDNIVFNK